MVLISFKNSDSYTEFDIERFAIEQPKRSGRKAFTRDKARVLHSAGLRRLAAKTQVMSPGLQDFLEQDSHTLWKLLKSEENWEKL